MKTLRLVIVSLFIASFALALRAGTLVELYTSQGCSACPVADELLERLDGDPDIIALAFHVDYWDYLGHIDPLADPVFSARQVAYQAKRGKKNIFTPQFIIGGSSYFSGSDEQAIMAELSSRQSVLPIAFVTPDRNKITVRLGEIKRARGNYDIMIAYVLPPKRVSFDAGENKGRTVNYVRSVQKLVSAGAWDGKADAVIEVPRINGMKSVLFVQQRRLGNVPFAIELD